MVQLAWVYYNIDQIIFPDGIWIFVFIPAFFVIFVVLAVRVSMLPGAAEGYKFMFTLRWDALKDPMAWVWAMLPVRYGRRHDRLRRLPGR